MAHAAKKLFLNTMKRKPKSCRENSPLKKLMTF
jgi:hypothetical protein